MDKSMFAETKKKIEKLMEELREESQAAFAQESKAIFDRYPSLYSFGWKQYTKYWNDGDECTFRVHSGEPDINGAECYDIYYGKGEFEKNQDVPDGWPKMTKEEAKPIQKEVAAFLDVFESNIMHDMFEDHVKVTVTREGVQTESYEHE